MQQFNTFTSSILGIFLIIIVFLFGLIIYNQVTKVPKQEQRTEPRQVTKTPEQEQRTEPKIVSHLYQQDNVDKKIKKIAETIWCENRKSFKSMNLVMSVIYNRAKEKTLDGLYTEVIKPKQFSCLNSAEIIPTQIVRQKDKERLILAYQIVWKFMNGDWKPITDAKFFYAPDKVKLPEHLKDKKLILDFEGHHFY